MIFYTIFVISYSNNDWHILENVFKIQIRVFLFTGVLLVSEKSPVNIRRKHEFANSVKSLIDLDFRRSNICRSVYRWNNLDTHDSLMNLKYKQCHLPELHVIHIPLT